MGEAGKPLRKAGQTVSGVWREGGKAGAQSAEGTGAWGPGRPRGGMGKGGPSEGVEKREFKLLTLLVFFK